MRRLTFLITIAAVVVLCFPAYGLNKPITNEKPRYEKLRIFDRYDEFFKPKKALLGVTPVFSKIKAKIDVSVQEAKYGVMECDVSSTFSVDEEYQLEKRWYNVVWQIKIFEILIDNIPIKFHFYDYKGNILDFLENRTLKPGTHTIRIKYHYKMYIPPSYYNEADIWTYCGVDGFHLFNNWYFLPDNFDFTDVVDFDMDMSVPPNWYLCGNYVPEEYRDKPSPNGKYKFLSRTDAPFGYRVLGGEYEMIKKTVGDSNIRIYSFKDSKGDGPFIAEYGASCLEFFGEYFNHQSKGDYFVAQIRCTPGQGFGCEGGFAIDAPYLTKNYFMPEFLAHEMAHVSWWGGDGVCGIREKPHSRFMSEAFAELSSFLFCEKRVGLGYYNYVIANEESLYWKYCVGGAPLSSSTSADSFPITYYKGGLVLNCLKSWMGEEAFQNGIREVIDTYVLKDGQDPDNRPRCSQQIFKQIMEKAYGKPLDDFWRVYFDSTDVPIPVIDIVKQKNTDGTITDKLSFEYKGNGKLPIRAMVYYADGTSEEFTNPSGKNVYALTKQCVGLENLTWKSLIHEKNTTYHTMGTSTVAAILKWRKPTVVCLDEEFSQKAEEWANFAGVKVSTSPSEDNETSSVILVGPRAINNFAPEALPAMPAKCVGGSYLEWYTLKMMGEFSMTSCSPNPKNYHQALILDLSSDGKIPKDLTWTSYFFRSDGCFETAYRSMANGVLIPPKPDFLKIPWMENTAKVYDSRYSLTFDVPKGYNLSYDGFDEKEFKFASIEVPSESLGSSKKIILDLSDKMADLRILRRTPNLFESWKQTQIYDGKGKEFSVPDGLKFDGCSKSSNYTVSWLNDCTYLYRLDGKVTQDWQSGNSLMVDKLDKSEHKLDIVFINENGLLSQIQSGTFKSGQTDPKLEILTKKVLWKNKMVTVKGQTDPGATIEPKCDVAPDGSFELVMPSDKPIPNLKIVATNDCGYGTSKIVPVTKYVKFFLTLGSMIAKDYEGNVFPLQAPAQMVKGSTYVPMRFIGDQLGATVNWDAKAKKVTYILFPNTVEIWIGNKTAKINGNQVQMPGPPVIVSNKTLVPLRFVGNALGAGILWDKDTKTATVEYPQAE